MTEIKKQYKIWWSPVGWPNGERIILAKDEREAKGEALEEMRRWSLMGAYGAVLLDKKE